jgi:two-component system sensor histidine kinase ChiS
LVDGVTQDDFATLQRLQEEFAVELTAWRGRVDALEARTAELEANQRGEDCSKIALLPKSASNFIVNYDATSTMLFQSLKRSLILVSGKVPLRVVLVVPFVIQVVTAVGLVGYLSFRNGQQAVNDVASQLRSEIGDRIKQKLLTYLSIPHQINQSNRNAIELGLLSVENLEPWKKYLWRQVSLYDSVSIIAVGNEQRQYITVGRIDKDKLTIGGSDSSTGFVLYRYNVNERGELTTVLDTSPNYDPRNRPWYKAAVQAGKPTWSEIFPHFVERTLNISAVQPLYDKDRKLEGVLNIMLRLSQVGDFLQTLKIGKTGQAFIIEPSGMLVATSTTELPFRISTNKTQRVLATDSTNPLTRATAKYLATKFSNLNQITSPKQLDFQIDGKRQFFQVLPLKDDRGLNWLIVVVVPEADFMEQINANTRTTILLCLLALALATGVGILTSRWVIQPILRLKDAASHLSQGEFNQTVNLERSDELGVLANAFTSMATQLQASFTTLERKNAELQCLDKLKDEFLANTSHEIRTPLNGIIGIAESLIDGATGKLPEKTVSNLGMIASSGRRLSHLINDILDFSKLRHQNIELQIKPVGVRELAEIVLMLSQPLVGKKSLQLINSISPNIPVVDADENRIQQILHNLIGNAIKFTDLASRLAFHTLHISRSHPRC